MILRNTEGSYLAAWRIARGRYSWREAALNALRWSLILCGIALSVGAIGSLASIFSSRITNAIGNDVLLASPSCGYLNPLVANSSTTNTFVNQKVLNDTIAGNAYARACYENSSSALQCGMFVESRFNYTEDQNATCPFAPDTCLYSDTAALQFDTGHLDSLEAFGLNSPKHDRVTYRRLSTCAPLNITGSMFSVGNKTKNFFGTTWEEEYIYYLFGPQGTVSPNYTFAYAARDSATVDDYTVRTTYAVPQSIWLPIPELNRTGDADVGIVGIAANFITYSTPIDDPIFAAHFEQNIEGVSHTQYFADRYMNFIVCTDQHQFCYSNTSSIGNCTRLSGSTDVANEMALIDMTPVQRQISLRIFTGLTWNHILALPFSRGASALRAQEAVYIDALSTPLPNNQWMIECRSWFNTALARLQRSVVDFAVGPAYEEYLPYYLTNPGYPAWDKVCHSQRVKNPGGFQSFSVLGVALVSTVGTLIILLGLCIDTVVGFIQKKFFPEAKGWLAWALDNMLQQQRMAYEGAGWGRWDVNTSGDAVPVMRPDGRVGRYTRTDGEWATIARPSDEDLLVGSTPVIGKDDQIPRL